MRLVFMGTSEFAVPALRSLRQAGHEIAAVVTRPDRPRRSQSSPPAPSPVKIEAAAGGLSVLDPESIREEAGFADRLRALGPEAIVVVAFGQILPPEILAIPPRGCVNLHASLLPRYRGAAPIARAILDGEKVTGVTTIRMNRGIDTGDILMKAECAIGLAETAGELERRLSDLGAGVLVETMERLARGTLEPRRQDDREATPAPPLRKEEGRIDWSATAQEITDRVRACNPWPLAVAWHRGKPLQILRAEVSLAPVALGVGSAAPGEVVAAHSGRIAVQCRGDSLLDILELRPSGGGAMTARDALNGRLVRLGEILARAPEG
jgi:methionyl-tRNA formyltransferase